MKTDPFKDKKILVLGLGREGADSLDFLINKYPKNPLGVADQAELDALSERAREILGQHQNIHSHLGANYLSAVDEYDIIIKSPGIPIHIPEIEQAYKKNKITSQTEIFFKHCPGTIIGVTGTKGKSTTASLIFEVLRKGGKKVSLIGNIGVPMLSFLRNAVPDDIFVCELSAHQLYNLDISPRIAVLLNIYKEHLDYYKDYDEYIRSKANIAINQSKSDYLIYNSANPESRSIAARSRAQKIAFNEFHWKFLGQTKLIGTFNLQNAKIAAIIGRLCQVSDEVINSAIGEFQPLPYRLEFAGNYRGVDCYNDSLSTIQESAVAAIEGLGEQVYTLIAGGHDRGQPFEKLAESILLSNIRTLILFPVTGQRIWQTMRKAAGKMDEDKLKSMKVFFTDSMEEAARLALGNTPCGKICLLSSASASFGNFRDYRDRGNQFKEYLQKISSKNK
jgi:UDP-N-acetylmuramoylalanine--D-glutamate ligase